MKKIVSVILSFILILSLALNATAAEFVKMVTAEKVVVYEKASTKSAELATLKEGFEFTPTGETKSFWRIEYKENDKKHVGYILKKHVEEQAITSSKGTAVNKPVTTTKGIKVNDSLNFLRNENAKISITGKPNTEYSIAVYYKSGKSTADGLHSKKSDANGHVSWVWKIGGKTTPGTYRAVIKGGGEEKTIHFTVQ